MLVEYKQVDLWQKDAKVLNQINFTANKGEFIYIIGAVGAGKSSILKSIYAELPIQTGEANVLGFDMKKLKRKHLPELRRQLGIVFQDFQLLSDRTVKENLLFVLKATGWKKKADIELRIAETLSLVKMEHKADKYPHELSGGEQQRVAIARAILNKPKLILADEPTGNLDRETGQSIVKLLRSICLEGTTIVMTTHNLDLLTQFPGIVYHCLESQVSEVTKEYNSPLEINPVTSTDNT